MNEETQYFECSCHSTEHTLKFVLDEDKDFPCVYVSVFLSELRWYERVIRALKYIFGYKCRYGHFEEFLMKREDCDRFISLIQRFKKTEK